MTAKDLKNALLQEAVQGKLVPQIASEGNARDLLEEIRKEKLSHGLDLRLEASLAINAKSGKRKSKKETALAGSNPCDITEEEIPFDIPENWCWCRLGDCVNVQSSKRVFEKDYVKSGIPFYRSKEIGELSKGNPINTELFITNDHYKKLKETVGLPQKGDILLCSIGGSIGNTWINDGRDFYYKDGNVTQICNNKFMDTVFINYYLHSELFAKQVKSEVVGSAYNALTIIKIKNLLFPLPPLAEQKRIVAAIEKFMPLIEEYGKKETQLKAINEKIGTLTKKAILQEAVQGKLVPQIASEGNARDLLEEIRKEKLSHGLDFANAKSGKRKSKKETASAGSNPCDITEDEIPFDIPESWCLCRLGEICNLTSGQDLIPEQYNSQNKGIPYITGASNFSNENIIVNRWTEYARAIAEENDLLLTCKGTVGEMAFLHEKKVHIARQVMGLHFNKKIDSRYMKYFITTQINNLKSKAKSMIPGIARDDVIKLTIPLPPLAEQKRIVVAIEKMLPLCEKLGE